jgi:hypothetical protein
MGLNFRARPRLGPFRLNIGKRGPTSLSTVLGPLTHNSRTGKWTINLPGGFSYSWGGRR